MKGTIFAMLVVIAMAAPAARQSPATSPGAGAVIVLDTAKGRIEFETYPEEAPKTVARVMELVGRGFYDGQRFHRAEANFLIQIGDPASRDLARREVWGRGASGTPIGAAEITRKRRTLRGAVVMTYAGSDPRTADSQFYILLSDHPELEPRYTVFGQVIAGMDVADRIQRDDLLTKASVKAPAAVP